MSHEKQEKEVRVENTLGLHFRPASKLVRLATQFAADVTLARPGHEQVVNCKSMMEVLLLAADQGTRLVLRADGPDAEEAVMKISELFEKKFEEE